MTEKSFESGSSKGRLEIQDKPRFKKRFSNQVLSKFAKACDPSVSNPKSQKGRGTSSQIKKPICEKCGKKQMGDFPWGWRIALGVAKVVTNFEISPM